MTFYLVGNGEAVAKAELTEENGWTASVTVLRNADGKEIEYKWVEPTVSGYKLASETSADGKTTFTNTPVNKEPTTHTVTIKYRTPEGKPVAKPVVLTLKTGDKYDVVSPKIDGYTCQWPRVIGIVPDRDIVITVYYTEDFVPAFIGDVYINSGDCFE